MFVSFRFSRLFPVLFILLFLASCDSPNEVQVSIEGDYKKFKLADEQHGRLMMIDYTPSRQESPVLYQEGSAKLWLKEDGGKHIYKIITESESGNIIIYLTLQDGIATQEVFDNDGRQVVSASLKGGKYSKDLRHIEFTMNKEDHKGFASWDFTKEGYANVVRIISREDVLLWQQSSLARFKSK